MPSSASELASVPKWAGCGLQVAAPLPCWLARPPTGQPAAPPCFPCSSALAARFYAVVSLGRNICGHPRIVHGGLTAALIDETLGGLMFALRSAQDISLPGPMYTVGAGCWGGVAGWLGATPRRHASWQVAAWQAAGQARIPPQPRTPRPMPHAAYHVPPLPRMRLFARASSAFRLHMLHPPPSCHLVSPNRSSWTSATGPRSTPAPWCCAPQRWRAWRGASCG